MSWSALEMRQYMLCYLAFSSLLSLATNLFRYSFVLAQKKHIDLFYLIMQR